MTTRLEPIKLATGEIIYRRTVDLDDAATGFHAHGEGDKLLYFRASLPRLLHGENGKLLKNQAELDAALKLMWEKIAALGAFSPCDFWFTRVDLALQFRGDPVQFVRAHRSCRHPRIHQDPVSYDARSWAVKGKEMRISIYDKTRQRFKRDGNIVRVEIKLSGGRLKELLGKGEKVTVLSFDSCYRAYREIILGLQSAGLPTAQNKGEFLAIAEREGWSCGGVSAFELYTSGKSREHISRLKRDMAAWRPSVFKIDWSTLLPLECPPPVVEIEDQ